MNRSTLQENADRRLFIKSLAELRDPRLFDLANTYITEAESKGDTKLLVDLKLELAHFYFSIRSDHNKAKDISEEVLPVIKGWQDNFLLARVNKRLGTYSYYLSDYFTAGKHYNIARQLLEQMETLSQLQEVELADIYYNLAVVYRTDKYNDYRIEMNFKALQILNKYNDIIRIGRSYNLMGNILLDTNKNEEALQQYLKALSVFETAGNNEDITITYTYNNIGTCYTKLGKYKEALTYLEKSLALRKERGSPNEVGVAVMLIGMNTYAAGDLATSEEYFLKAVKIFQETGNTFDLSHTSLQIANLYKLSNNYQRRCEFLELHLSLQETLNNEDKRRSLAEVMAEAKFEQKEAEAELLRQKNTEIEEFAKKLQISNEELNQFAHIVSHDLKEPLRMISTYIKMLDSRFSIGTNPEAKQFMDFILGGTDRMNNLIQELLAYSKVGAYITLQETDLNDVMKIAGMNLSGLVHEKNAVIENNPLPLIESDKTMMVQLFQNLLGNGLKYNTSSVPTAGVKVVDSQNETELHFYDNGVGVPAEYRKKVFEIFRRLPNAKDIQGTGIGLSICCKIISKLNGRIWIEANGNQGSVFKVALPKLL